MAALVAASFLTSTTADALQCGPRSTIEAWLKDSYGEEQVFVAVNRGGDQIQLFLNADSGSWSAVLRPQASPDLLCSLDSGQAGRLIWTVGPQVGRGSQWSDPDAWNPSVW